MTVPRFLGDLHFAGAEKSNEYELFDKVIDIGIGS
jgi:hypothetical protein